MKYSTLPEPTRYGQPLHEPPYPTIGFMSAQLATALPFVHVGFVPVQGYPIPKAQEYSQLADTVLESGRQEDKGSRPVAM
jgi:hypothetical protein